MMTIYGMMSPTRQSRIRECLAVWKATDGRGVKNLKKTHCPRGHAYDDSNTYHSLSKTGRTCRKCRNYLRDMRSAVRLWT